MKKFIVYLLVIVLAVSMGFAVFYLVRDNEVISISSASIYKDAGEPFQIDVNHENKKSYTSITISTSNANIVSYDKESNTFKAESGGVARINFRTSNAKFRNLWCDVIVGDGTIESPYYISTPEQLASIGMGDLDPETGVYKGSTAYNEKYEKYSSDKCYKLVSDIDVKDINEGYWVPLREFSGRLDGNGFVISNVNIDRDNYRTVFENLINFPQDYVGLFQKISSTGMVYNLKLSNVYASGKYQNFGVITAENRGIIERVEVKDAYLSVESDVFGGLVANNITTDSGENDSYTRNIARIDRCSINMTAGKKFVIVDDEEKELISGMNGIVGGLVGKNEGGIVIYSYCKGEVAFADDSSKEIVYGGIIGVNSYKTFTKTGGKYVYNEQGGNIKDCYSDLVTNFDCPPTNVSSLFGGAIGQNLDYSSSKYDNTNNKDLVHNYLIGVYYNKDNLNATQEGITKGFNGIASFKYNTIDISYVDAQKIVFGLSEEDMKVGDNYISHTIDEIEFDENGISLGLKESDVQWLFNSVWGIDSEINNGKPYLNYQLIYIPDDFVTAGTPVIIDENRYILEKSEIETTPVIISGTSGIISMQVGETYAIKVSPSGITYNWQSSDDTIVSVNNGTITAHKEGRVLITVSNKSGISDSVTVIVTSAPFQISGLPEKITLKAGETYTLSPTITNGITSTTATYLSDNTAVAEVSASGVITAKAEGTCFIYVTAGDTKEKVEVQVYKDTSAKVVTLSVIVDGTTVTNGGTINKNYSSLSGVITTSAMYGTVDVTSQVGIEYKSSNAKVIAIDNSGRYTIVGTGRAVIKINVDSNNYTGVFSFIINVVAPSNPTQPIENLQFNLSGYTLYVGQTVQISATVTGGNNTVCYYSGDETIAEVSANGVITAKGAGTTQITGYIIRSDGSYSYAYCNVVVIANISANKNLTVTPQTITVEVGQVVDMVATLENGDSLDIIDWKATCSPSGCGELEYVNQNNVKFKTKKAGTINIIVTSGNLSVTAIITITDPNVYSKYIYNVNQLKAIQYHLDKDFILASNIDLTGIEWSPIGTKSSPFTGTLKNNGNYKITNITVNNSNDYSGLFGYVKNARIENIIIENGNICGKYVGSIVGAGDKVTLNGCKVLNSTLQGTIATGGIIGYSSNNSIISNCETYSNVTITSVSGNYSGSKYAGGIVGNSEKTTISGSKVTGSVSISLGSGTSGYAGGIAGYTNSSINSSLVEANITANSSDNDYAGGIVGYSNDNIFIGVVRNSTISGYYAGGIGGALNNSTKITISFSSYKDGYRKSDVASSSYSANVTQMAIKSDVKITGSEVGGLFGIINAGVVQNCYTMAELRGSNSSAVKGGFASSILSSGICNNGGTGYVGIVENCYSACSFNSTGNNYSITQSYVHNFKGNSASSSRPAGFCFNYLFDNDVDGKASYTSSGNIFAKDKIEAKKSTKEMKNSSTYSDKGFSASIWNITNGNYATLKIENNF